MSVQNTEFDELDKKIAYLLASDASLTNAAIGEYVGLSASAANERVRKLKSSGKIKKIAAIIESEFLDLGLGAFIHVLLDSKYYNYTFLKNISKNENVLECHHITGEYSYILKVRVKNTKELERFITDFLKTQEGVVKTMSNIIMSSTKDLSIITE